MLVYVKQVGLAVSCAACGLAAGLSAHSAPPPVATPRPCPASTPCPAQKPCPAPIALNPSSKPPPPPIERPATTHRDTPLSAFRFLGIGPSGGLRLARVRPGTLPAALGLQTGDELLTINDFRMTDPEQALTAYARLRYADRLNLVVARNGQKTAIFYFVR